MQCTMIIPIYNEKHFIRDFLVSGVVTGGQIWGAQWLMLSSSTIEDLSLTYYFAKLMNFSCIIPSRFDGFST